VKGLRQRLLRRLGALALGSALGLLLLAPSACFLDFSACKTWCRPTSSSCDARPLDRCAKLAGCELSEPSCVCADAVGCSDSIRSACTQQKQERCLASQGCAWSSTCHRPHPCSDFDDRTDDCKAAGCEPHHECD
jgi:hypothetical protein